MYKRQSSLSSASAVLLSLSFETASSAVLLSEGRALSDPLDSPVVSLAHAVNPSIILTLKIKQRIFVNLFIVLCRCV